MQHFFNFQGNAVMSVLTFLGTGLLLAAVSGVTLYARLKHRHTMLRSGTLAGAVVAAAYLATLLGFSLASRDQLLGMGEEKYFCEVDCHVAYTVTGVSTVSTLGPPPDVAQARGMFYVVTLRTRFDESTASPQRGDFPLKPNPRRIWVVGENGTRYAPSGEGMQALARADDAGVPLGRPLRPRESYTSQLVFDLPRIIRSPRLLIIEADWVTRLLISHENSPFHKKTYFQLEPTIARANE